MTILNSFFVERQKWNQVKRIKHKDSYFEISTASLALQRTSWSFRKLVRTRCMYDVPGVRNALIFINTRVDRRESFKLAYPE